MAAATALVAAAFSIGAHRLGEDAPRIPEAVGAEAASSSQAVPNARAATTTLVFVGDLMFDRGVANHVDAHGIDSLFRGASSIFAGADAIVGNLEGTITTNESVARKDSSILHFTFDPKFAGLLAEQGFTAVSLANNHSTDFYAAGVAETRRSLADAGIQPFGSAYNDSDMTAKIERNGETICVIGYHDLYTEDGSPALAEIARVRGECSFVAVFPHWGVEYSLHETDRQQDLAHGFIDAGADLVIGSHPHVVEPVEIYKGRAIFYSLGNFIFDQGLSFWTEHGLAIRIRLGPSVIEYAQIPTALNRAEASAATSTADISKILDVTGEPAIFYADREAR